jgi:hypothetical protein
MAANAPEVQILSDEGTTTRVKIHGYYNASATGNTNTTVVTANALSFANTSQTCLLSVSKIEFASDMTNGVVALQWVGGSGNTNIVSLGGGQAGMFDYYIPNNATSPTGDINLATYYATGNDVYTIILTLNKESGYANAYLQYDVTGQRVP